MAKLKEYTKPVRKKNVEYRLQIYDGETPQDIVNSLQKAYGLTEFPANARFDVSLNPGYNYCYCMDGPCTCGCSCSAECYLVWTSEESDIDYQHRLDQYHKLIKAQEKRQAKKVVK